MSDQNIFNNPRVWLGSFGQVYRKPLLLSAIATGVLGAYVGGRYGWEEAGESVLLPALAGLIAWVLWLNRRPGA